MTSTHRITALAQFRREVAAGLRTPNDPTDALWEAMWLEIAASCWRLAGKPQEAAARLRDSAEVIIRAAEQKRGGPAQ